MNKNLSICRCLDVWCQLMLNFMLIFNAFPENTEMKISLFDEGSKWKDILLKVKRYFTRISEDIFTLNCCVDEQVKPGIWQMCFHYLLHNFCVHKNVLSLKFLVFIVPSCFLYFSISIVILVAPTMILPIKLNFMKCCLYG